MKTVQCPSCGASVSNLQNCEFCGSLFVRSSIVKYDTTSLFEKDEISYCFEGLQEAIQQNIDNQKKYKSLSGQVGTSVYLSKNDFDNGNDKLNIGFWNRDYEKNPLRGEVSMVLEVEDLREKPKILISQMEEFKLFDDIDSDGLWQIHFGTDVVGASFIISKILVEAYRVDISTILYFDHQVYSNNPPYNDLLKTNVITTNDSKKGNCFIATATMGSYDHPVVMDLRRFRDEWILKKSWGEDFVNFYYKYGPYPADFIKNKNWAKKISYYLIVKPFYYLSKIFN